MDDMKKIILGSGSERRYMLLNALGFDVNVVVSKTTEELRSDESPEDNALRIAQEKLAALAIDAGNTPVVCADTIVVCDGNILGKPKNLDDAQRMLALLSGKLHHVITAFVVKKGNIVKAGVIKTAVRFRNLTAREIAHYVATNSVLDKSGSYAIQDAGASLIDDINGSISNVIGLPVKEVLAAVES